MSTLLKKQEQNMDYFSDLTEKFQKIEFPEIFKTDGSIVDKHDDLKIIHSARFDYFLFLSDYHCKSNKGSYKKEINAIKSAVELMKFEHIEKAEGQNLGMQQFKTDIKIIVNALGIEAEKIL